MHDDDMYTPAKQPSGGYGAYLPGLVLILFGVLIFVVPRMLELVVAAFFIITGIMALGFGHKFRQSRKWSRQFFVSMFEDDSQL